MKTNESSSGDSNPASNSYTGQYRPVRILRTNLLNGLRGSLFRDELVYVQVFCIKVDEAGRGLLP